MTKTRMVTRKTLSVVITLLMVVSLFTMMPLERSLTAEAATPNYVNWRSSDSRWSGLKYADISVNASNYNASMNVAFAQAVAHLGVGDTDDSKFNPLTFYNSLKKKYDDLSMLGLPAWLIKYSSDASGLLNEYSSKISLVSTDTTSYSKSNFSTLASKLKSNHNNGYVSVLLVGNTWVTVYNASSSTAWIMDPSGKYSNLQYYMNDGAKVTCVYTFKSSTTRRATGWYDYKNTYAGKYYIKNVSTGKYLTVDGNKDANATNVSVADLTGAPGQIWTLSNGTDGYKILPGCSTTRTLNPYADTVKSGLNVNIYAGSGETQEWLINVFSGFVYIQNCQNANCALNVNSTNVNVTTLSYAKTQRWVLEPAFPTEAVSGTYYLKNKATGTYLYAGGTTSTSKVALGAKKTTTAYQMKISPVTSGNSLKGCYITPASGSVVLNPYADTPTNGTVVNLYTKNTDGTQYWVFEPVSGGYIIHNGSNKNLVLNGNSTNVTVATNKKADSQIWVLESFTKALSSISIATKPTKMTYNVGDKLDTTGLTIKATYTDGTSKTISTGFTATADLSKAGSQTVTVSYKEGNVTKTANFDVTVKNAISGITIAKKPDKTSYNVGEELDITGLTIEVSYADGSTKTISTGFTAEADLTTAGDKTVTVFYTEENVTKTASFKITVSDIDLNDDGTFNVADVVLFEKWLLADPDAKLSNWQTADLCEDGKLDVFDLVLMKHKLVN